MNVSLVSIDCRWMLSFGDDYEFKECIFLQMSNLNIIWLNPKPSLTNIICILGIQNMMYFRRIMVLNVLYIKLCDIIR